MVLAVALLAVAPDAAADEGWVGPLTALSPSPGAPADVSSSLAARVRRARQLGRHGEVRGAVTALLRALTAAPPPPLEREVLRALARRADPATLEPLLARLSAPGEPPLELFLALAALGAPALPALVKALDESAQQAFAAEALRRAGPAAVGPLAAALHGGPAATLAAELLGALGEPAATPALLGALAEALGSVEGSGGARAADQPAARTRLASAPHSVAAPERRGGNPELAASALTALARLGAVEAIPLALQALQPGASEALTDPTGPAAAGPLGLRLAAARALARLGATVALPALRRRLDAQVAETGAPRARDSEAAELLRALCSLDAPGCTPALDSALRSGPGPRFQVAREMLLTRPHPAWLGLLRDELGRSPNPAALAFALTRLPDPRGLPVLLDAIDSGTIALASALPPLAVLLRRWTDIDTDDTSSRQEALARLRAGPPGPRTLALRGIARDPQLPAALGEGLASESHEIRTGAALALQWFGPCPELRAPLYAAVLVERDTSAFRSLAGAALAQRLPVPLTALGRALADPETAPEALGLAALSGPSPELDRLLRRALADTRGSTRLRVAAALALAQLGSPRARPALLAALDDPSERVRLAALRAVAALGEPGLAPALFAHARAEPSTELALLARDLAHALREGRPTPALLHGDRVLALHAAPGAPMSAAPGAPTSTPIPSQPLEALLPDGRWLRVSPIAPGEWLVADLPEAGVLVWPSPALPLSN